VLLLLVVFLSVNVSVLVLRRDRVENDHFRVWTFVPVLGIGSCILLLTQQRPAVWLFGGILLAVGGALYVLARWGRKHAEKKNTHPDGKPVDNQEDTHEHA
jgi:amino acid transporter